MRILLALDGSDASMTALAAAAALPLPPDTTIELLTVVADDRTIYGGAWPAAALILGRDRELGDGHRPGHGRSAAVRRRRRDVNGRSAMTFGVVARP